MPPEHFVAIRPPLYLDPECRYVDDEPRPLDAEWTDDAVAALDEFSRDVRAWAARSGEEGVVCLRLQRGDAWVTEAVFDHDSVPASALPALARFVGAVTRANLAAGEPLWRDDEHHLGDVVATRVAERSRAEVPAFVRFLESNDLDHEVEQAYHVRRVVAAHGWGPQTLALWVARLGTCAGQHGHETPWREYTDASVADYVRAEPARRDLLETLLAGNMASLVQSSLVAGADDALDALDRHRTLFWGDLGDQGLDDLAPDIAAAAHARARDIVTRYAGQPAALPHWLELPEG